MINAESAGTQLLSGQIGADESPKGQTDQEQNSREVHEIVLGRTIQESDGEGKGTKTMSAKFDDDNLASNN